MITERAEAGTSEPNTSGEVSKDVTKIATKSIPDGLFYLYDGVTKASVLALIQQMENWSGERNNDGKALRIILNSPGGSVIDGFALMDEIASVRGRNHKVTIVAYGMAASAAGFILQSADSRVIGANSWILIHQASSSAAGKLSAIEDTLNFTMRLQDQFLERLSKRSKLSLQAIHQHIDAGQDWWISAQDALKFGLVDSIEPVTAFTSKK